MPMKTIKILVCAACLSLALIPIASVVYADDDMANQDEQYVTEEQTDQEVTEDDSINLVENKSEPKGGSKVSVQRRVFFRGFIGIIFLGICIAYFLEKIKKGREKTDEEDRE